MGQSNRGNILETTVAPPWLKNAQCDSLPSRGSLSKQGARPRLPAMWRFFTGSMQRGAAGALRAASFAPARWRRAGLWGSGRSRPPPPSHEQKGPRAARKGRPPRGAFCLPISVAWHRCLFLARLVAGAQRAVAAALPRSFQSEPARATPLRPLGFYAVLTQLPRRPHNN